MSTPIYDATLAEHTARLGHAPGDATLPEQAPKPKPRAPRARKPRAPRKTTR